MNKVSISAVAACLACIVCLPLRVRGQADSPASVTNAMPTAGFGFNMPTHLGAFTYALSASEMLQTGYTSGVDAGTSLSGELAYISKSERNPFSMVYTGGYLFSAFPGSHSSSTFQDLSLSQVMKTRSWLFVVSDGLSYLPGSPTTGLSGVAGVGDVGLFPVQTGLGPAQDILTTYSNRISNGLNGSATWQTDASLDLQASGSWQVLHFTGVSNPGIDSNSYSGSFGPNYRIDARTSFGADAYYNYSTYPLFVNYKVETEGVNVNFNRAWTRRLSTSVSLGPQVTHGRTTSVIPAQTEFSAGVSASYATRTTGINAAYTRGVNAGSGVTFGAMTNTVTLGMTRPINRDWQLGIDGDYSRSVGLAKYLGVLPVYDTAFGAAQVSRRLTESLSCYGSLTVTHQSSPNNIGINAFNGTYQVIGFGVTFAPAPLNSGR